MFYVRFLSNKRRCLTSKGIQSWAKFAYIGKVSHLVPRDQISTPMFISAESFPFLLEIFFVKHCIGEITRFVAAVK